MKAKPVRIDEVKGYVACSAEEATHLTINLPGPVGKLTIPIVNAESTDRVPRWTWNWSVDRPTLTPRVSSSYISILNERSWESHAIVKDGHVTFLQDTTHNLRGKTVPLNDV